MYCVLKHVIPSKIAHCSHIGFPQHLDKKDIGVGVLMGPQLKGNFSGHQEVIDPKW